MRLNDLIHHMRAIAVRIIEECSHRILFEGHIKEIRETGFKKDFEVISIFRDFEYEYVDILVKEVK